MISEIVLGQFGWLPAGFARGVGRVFRRLAYTPIAVVIWIGSVAAMVWSWLGILRGDRLAMLLWFVAPLFAIGVAIAWFDRPKIRSDDGAPAA